MIMKNKKRKILWVIFVIGVILNVKIISTKFHEYVINNELQTSTIVAGNKNLRTEAAGLGISYYGNGGLTNDGSDGSNEYSMSGDPSDPDSYLVIIDGCE